jgi:FHA domain
VLEFSRDNEAPEAFPSHKPQISIGRGAKDIQVDLRLDGDLEISRKQATIERLADGRFAVTCEGRNALEVAGRELAQGDRVEFDAGDSIKIGIYRLRCVARASLVEPSA